ncbi:MAG TPA: hypothetical protein VMR31_07490 [Myxococcota bacterium]|nr:hypothetical protein [Myxococcota bacterium]
MKHWRVTLAAVASLTLATAAFAGFKLGFGNPVNDTVCGAIDVVGQMQDPNYFELNGAGGTKQCAAACKLAASACKKQAKLNAACQAGQISRQEAFLDLACAAEISADQVKSCRSEVHVGTLENRASNRSDLISALTGCDSWNTECQMDCAGPV